MKKGIILGILAVLSVSSAVAAENVKVEIDNNVNSSNSNSSTVRSHSRVEVTTNGETKVFESNGEDVNYQSPDGKTKVNIKASGNEDVSVQNTVDSVTQDVQGTVDTAKNEVKKTFDKNQEEIKTQVQNAVEEQKNGIIERIVDFFKNLFNF